MKDNPNQKASIAIMCNYKFFFDAFLSTYKHLSKIANVEFVIDFSAPPAGYAYPEEYKEFVRNTLKSANVFFRDFESGNLAVGEFFAKYNTLVASSMVGYMNHACNKDKKKVRVMYGLAKDGWAYGLYNAHFDLILCAGPFSESRLSPFYSAKIVSVGEPKLDGLYEDGLSSEKARIVSSILDRKKKTVLYMPTWGVLSSSKVTIPALLNLLPYYNIVIKIHHMTSLFSSEEMKFLDDDSFIIINEFIPVTDALKLADVVISDNSGSIFDALVAKKKLVLIDTIQGNESFFTDSPFFTSQSNNDAAGVVSSAESIEQIVKGENLAPVVALRDWQVCVDFKELKQAIDSSGEEQYRKAQQELVDRLYSHLDGFAGERSAQEIVKLMNNSHKRDRTLERYVEEYTKRIKSQGVIKNSQEFKSAESIANKVKAIRSLPEFKRFKVLYEIFFENK
jgi:hypothetical protein